MLVRKRRAIGSVSRTAGIGCEWGPEEVSVDDKSKTNMSGDSAVAPASTEVHTKYSGHQARRKLSNQLPLPSGRGKLRSMVSSMWLQ